MGTNPMQKIKRNSILTGLIIGLVIGLILCVIVYLFLTSDAGKKIISKDEEVVIVYALNKAVKSGEKITVSDIIAKNMSESDVPYDTVNISKDVIAKIDLPVGTILTKGMINTNSDTLTNDLREQEYNMISLPSELQQNDFIDIRLQLPSGGDYIVVSKKQVIKCNETTVWLNMNEEEIEVMSNAIIEYYIMAGSKLYATTYTDPGLQVASTPTYCPNTAVSDLLANNPNIDIKDGTGRLMEKLKTLRNTDIKTSLERYTIEEALGNIENNLKDEIDSLKKARESYIGTLNSTK